MNNGSPEMLTLGFGQYIPKDDVIGIYDITINWMRLYVKRLLQTKPLDIMDCTCARPRKTMIETKYKLYLSSYPVDVMVRMYQDRITLEDENEMKNIETKRKKYYSPKDHYRDEDEEEEDSSEE